jgi:hypothetical protein
VRLEGNLDRCDATKLEGWLIDHDDPEEKLQLAIYSGATLLGTSTANRFRQDLADGGLARGLCAFDVELPNSLSAAELHELRICIVGTEYLFPPRIGRPVYGLVSGDLYKSEATELLRAGRRWAKFETCILHIGTEKTGSTSLQSCFGLNRVAFEHSGYFIPRSLAPQANDGMLKHTFLAAISMSDDKFADDLRRRFHMIDAERLNQGRRDLFRSFSEEVAAAPNTCRTVILSDEHCHSRLSSPEEVQNLKDFLDRFCDNYRIALYLRPQHELAISQYGMFIANGYYDIDMLPLFPPPESYGKQVYTNSAYFDYRALLERWAEVFGDDALHPRIYAADALRGGDVVKDFTSDLALGNGQLEMPLRLNPDISAGAQAFLMAFYRCLDAKERVGAEMLRERVRNAVRACFPGSGATPARAEVTAFLDQFAQSNEIVRARWFPERPRLFDIDLDRYPEKPKALALNAQEIMGMLVEVLQMDQEMRFSLSPESLHWLVHGLPPSTK